MALRLPLLLALLLGCAGKSQHNPKPQSSDPNLPPIGRLGNASVPTSASLHIEIDPSSEVFHGQIHIEIDIKQSLNTLWLHQRGLEIASAHYETTTARHELFPVQSADNKELLGLKIQSPRAADKLSLPLGQGTLQITFSGQVGEQEGLFHQKAKNQWYAYTDFEATDARAAFPCYDDPRFRIPWDIEIVVPEGQSAFANTREVSKEKIPGQVRELFRFATTRMLPSYLVAFAAGPFELIEGRASNTPLRVIAPRGMAEAGRFVLETTDTWLRFLEDYLNMPMPYEKLDFIAVPQFGGAMENPGLVTFSAGILLTGENADAAAQWRAAGVTTHELAHLWFGDSLTPHYWNDLWLSEAFATWLSDKAMANWQPSRAREILRIADKSTAFPIDHDGNGRRVREPIESAEDIDAAFDAITYRKGGALLTMLEGWIGEAAMQKAVRLYLRENIDTSVRARDWIRSLTKTVPPKKNTEAYFRSFLTQTGIPQVSLRLECGAQTSLGLEQKRYLPLGVESERGEKQRWTLPICVRYPSENGLRRQCALLDQEHATLSLDTSACPDWILPNDRESGYYHYNLSAKYFRALIDQAELDPRETQGLMYSVLASFKAGDLDFDDAIPLIGKFASNPATEIQSAVIPFLYELSQSVVGPNERTEFSKLVRIWYRPILAPLGISSRENDTGEEMVLRSRVSLLLAHLGQEERIKAEIGTAVDHWLDQMVPMNPLQLHTWLLVTAIDGDAALMQRYVVAQTKTSNRLHAAILAGAQLGFRNPELFASALDRGIEMGLRGTLVDVLQSAVASPALLGIANNAMIRNKDTLIGKKDGPSRYARIAEVYAKGCSEAAKSAASAFAGDEFESQVSHSAANQCIAFGARYRAEATAFFTNKSDSQ